MFPCNSREIVTQRDRKKGKKKLPKFQYPTTFTGEHSAITSKMLSSSGNEFKSRRGREGKSLEREKALLQKETKEILRFFFFEMALWRNRGNPMNKG